MRLGGRIVNALFQGRPSALRTLATTTSPGEDVQLILTGLFTDGDTVLEREAAERLTARQSTPGDSANTSCLLAIRTVFRGGAPPQLDTALVRRHAKWCLDFLVFDLT